MILLFWNQMLVRKINFFFPMLLEKIKEQKHKFLLIHQSVFTARIKYLLNVFIVGWTLCTHGVTRWTLSNMMFFCMCSNKPCRRKSCLLQLADAKRMKCCRCDQHCSGKLGTSFMQHDAIYRYNFHGLFIKTSRTSFY